MQTVTSSIHVLAIATLLSMIALPASAQWQHFPNGVPVAVSERLQENPEIVSDGAGGAIIVWRETHPTYGFDLRAQRIDDTGYLRWDPAGAPVATGNGNQSVPRVLPDGAGGAFVTWVDNRSGDFDVYAQRLDSNGGESWTTNGVPLVTAANTQSAQYAVSDGVGGWIVAWTDRRAGAVAQEDLYAQRIDGLGSLHWMNDGVPLCTATARQSAPSGFASDGAGGVIATWMDLRAGAGAWDLYTQRLDGLGAPQWTTDGRVLSAVAQSQHAAASTPDGFGGAITVWLDGRNGQDDVYAQRIDGTGAPQWTAGGVPVAVAPNNKFNLRLVSDGSGGAIVTWHDFRDQSTGADIYVQRISPAGTVLWATNGIQLCGITGNQFYPELAEDGSGGAFVTWADERSGTDWHVYMQRIDSNGAPQWNGDGTGLSGGVPLMRGANAAVPRPKVVSDGLGGAIVTWHANRNGSSNIYAQRVLGEGATSAPSETSSSLVLRGVHPNPSNGRATLSLELGRPSAVEIDVFDAAGRRVRKFSRPAFVGAQDVLLDDRDDRGRSLPNGVYFYRVNAGGQSRTVKVSLKR